MNWKDKYEEVRSYLVKHIAKSPPIVTGFNANIDCLRYADEELMNKLGRNYSTRKSVREIEDLGRGIMESIELGEANEWELENEEIYPAILDLGYDEFRIGGQAGIVSNLMACLGVNARVLLPVLAEEQAKMFSKSKVLVPFISPQGFGMRPALKAFDPQAPARYNCIFEFKQGFRKAVEANRFILSYRPDGYKPILDENLVLNANRIFSGVKRAFMSGYQLLESDNEFRKAREQVSYMKGFAPETKFHLELTNVEDSHKRSQILKVGKEYDSIGCNDVELDLYSGSDQIVSGMKRLIKKTGVKRLHVHAHENHYCMVRNDYLNAEKVRDCMMMGAVMASTKAYFGEVKNKSQVLKAEFTVGREGLDYLTGMDSEDGIVRLNNYSIIVIPNLSSTRVRSTVGLGDAISSTAFISEVV